MALNETIARTTVNSIAFLITQDGAAGTTMTLTNTDFVVNLQGYEQGGAFLALLSKDFAGNNQATQRAVLLGDASGLAGALRNLRNFPHCRVVITPRDAANGWAVDADVSAADAQVLRGELNITGPAGASSALVSLEFQNTPER